jgi:high-affinity iron transporter
MRQLVFLSSFFILATLSSCGAGAKTDASAALMPVPSEYAGLVNPFGADAAADGAVVYKINCEACHGPQGNGDGPAGAALNPPPQNLAVLQEAAGDDYLFWRVATGKDGTSMIGWKGILTDDQIWQVVAFIRTLE